MDETGDYKNWQQELERSLFVYLTSCSSSPTDLLQMVRGDAEKVTIRVTLRYCDNNQTKAAKMLGISRGTLRSRLYGK